MEQVKKRFPNAVVRDTMCDATVRRQTEILELCGRVEAMIVIGGKNSGNTRRLAAMLFLLAGLTIFPSVAWPLGFWMLIETVFMLRHGIASNKTGVVRRDFFVDSHLIAMGMLALVWNLWIA